MTETLPGFAEEHEVAPLTIIRTETVLSRFPIHRLMKRGEVQIEIRNQAAAVLWEVTHNVKYGQPGPLAYKLDTLIVNRRIEEAGRPVPNIIRLGSLRDICREIGNSAGGLNILAVRKALNQNASTYIEAKLIYQSVADRSERTFEKGFTRYSVIFTGEKLPDGSSADAVYLELNGPYMEVLNAAIQRPLDYNYMKDLPPAAQRFYEIASYQIYAAIHFQNERAKLRYSEYCMLSTATRYFDFDHVKKQMHKVHKYHLDSGYLAKATFEATIDSEGKPDWFMFYIPGPNAAREYQQFTGNTRRVGARAKKQSHTLPSKKEPLLLPFPEFGGEQGNKSAPKRDTESEKEMGMNSLVESLVAADLNPLDAERFAREKPDECRRQLLYLPFKANLENPGGYLRSAIEGGFPPPKEYRTMEAKVERERRKQEVVQTQMALEAAQRAAEATQEAKVDDSMARLETEAPEAFAAFSIFAANERRKAGARYSMMKDSIRAKMTQSFDTPSKRRELFTAWQALPESEKYQGEKQGEGTTDTATIATVIRSSLEKESQEPSGS